MGFFKNDKKGKPPHTWYPEILRWREGDQIFCWNISKAIGYMKAKSKDIAKYMADSGSHAIYATAAFKFKSVSEDGMIYLEFEDGQMEEFEFWRLIKCAENESLKTRKIEEKETDSQKYMELIQNFQHAFNELQEADNHPKRLGKMQKETE